MRMQKRKIWMLIWMVALTGGLALVSGCGLAVRAANGVSVIPNRGGNGAADISEFPGGIAAQVDKPPAVCLGTTKGEAICGTFATMGSYMWTRECGNGQAVSCEADCTPPREWEEMATIELEKTDGVVKIDFHDKVLEYTVSFWPTGSASDIGEVITVRDDRIFLQGDSAKGIYELNVIYQNGSAMYGFRVE